MTVALNLFWSELLVEECVRNGATYFCVSPGSRSTPLTLAAARNPKVETVVCYDERGAAFHALGHARATGRPAVVITTSGTAVANLLPAVVEASNDALPLLLLTADRPQELIDCGANQAIIQDDIFVEYVRWKFSLPCPTAEIAPEFVLTSIDQALSRSMHNNAGPVHINCHFREPLSGNDEPIEIPENLQRWKLSSKPYTSYFSNGISRIDDEVVKTINSTNSGLLFVGKLHNGEERDAVRKLIEVLGWPVYADISSGLRLDECGTNVMRYFDQDLLSEEFNDSIKPETVLHLGGRTVSKRVGLFFKENPPETYIVVKADSQRYDAVHRVTYHIESDIAEFALQLSQSAEKGKQEYLGLWNSMAEQADAIIASNIAVCPDLTEPFVAREITWLIADDSALFVSNSMPVRDVDIYGVNNRQNIRCAINRGASGIDGILATGAGFIHGCEEAGTIVVGDLAFIHDMNSLRFIAQSKQPIIVVVINNEGGGIFDFLPVSKEQDVFEEFFITPHSMTFEGVCETFGIPYSAPKTKEEFTELYSLAVDTKITTVIEVSTSRSDSFALRKKMKREILDMMTQKVTFYSSTVL